MSYIRSFLLFISLAFPIIVSAEHNTPTVDSKEQVITIAKGKLLEFDSYLKDLCSEDKIRDKSVMNEKLMNLFIGRGNTYSSVDDIDVNPVCAVLVSQSGTRKMPIKRLVKMYSTMHQSKCLQITDCEIYILEDIKELQDNRYSCIAHVRSLNRLMDTRTIYDNYHTRKLIIELPSDIDTKNGLVLLGDIYFHEIVKL